MDKQGIINLLKDYPQEEVEKFASYCLRLFLDEKNTWMKKRTIQDMATLYKRVAKDGLVFDGVHITLQSTGISYDYIAYKNKMFLSYPESTVDVGLVYEEDAFEFKKESGKVFYTHSIGNPFGQNELKMKGGYCIIKNKRGEFITLLSKEDIDKHRKVAKTDQIWRQWFIEMALKTIIKKACKQHFSDIYQNIETIDNDNYDLDNPLDIELKYKQEIEAITTIEDLAEYAMSNTGKGKDFDKMISIRKKQLDENS